VLQLGRRNQASLALRGHHLVPQSRKGVEHRLGMCRLAELPAAWRAKLAQAPGATVTVRIEQEEAQAAAPPEEFVTDDPLFGMWRDRDDMADVAGYVRSTRAHRFNDDGTRRKESLGQPSNCGTLCRA
jgi:hypothetical protein